MKETENNVWEILHQTALSAPKKSGVYLWKNSEGTVIYVGKAVNLKNRLTSYFSGKKDIKTASLVKNAVSIEYITTPNEYEALILENNLIKKHMPRYNISLKDGKTYPMIRITNEKFPRVFKTRYMVSDGSKYFGPFPNGEALAAFMDFVDKYYPLRKCRKLVHRDFPCLYYHIGRCSAPCSGKVSVEKYMEYVKELSTIIEKSETKEFEDVILKLESKMKESAENLDFEKAGMIRDGINALKGLSSRNLVEDFDLDARDYISFYTEGMLISFIVFKMRGGQLSQRDLFRVTSMNTPDELMGEFICSYYGKNSDIPPYIFVSSDLNLDLIRRWFKEELNVRVSIMLPVNKKHQAVMSMATLNAKEDVIRRKREEADTLALEELKAALSLEKLPHRIEGFDIAHIGGNLPVASLVSFFDGNPDKKNYRTFRLKTTEGIVDDFASMREAAARRYTGILNSGGELPDFILIDGGAGQVSAVKGILNALDLEIPIAGLAKEDEEIYLPGQSNPVKLPRNSAALRLLQRVRDETHRFATTKNQNLRTKENTETIFKKLPGIGPKKALVLFKEFVSLENFCAGDPEIISSILKCSPEAAEKLLKAGRNLLSEREEKIRHLKDYDLGGHPNK